MQGKRYEDEDLPTWRYAEIFKVLIPGEEPVLAAAMNCQDAIRKAAEELGIDPGIAKKMATVETPTAKELVSCARAKGLMLQMRVSAEGYPDCYCNAYCRQDAILQAANEWNASYYEIRSKARVDVSRKIDC